jgi:hypothetical protein
MGNASDVAIPNLFSKIKEYGKIFPAVFGGSWVS